jgi:hypothetical protein
VSLPQDLKDWARRAADDVMHKAAGVGMNSDEIGRLIQVNLEGALSLGRQHFEPVPMRLRCPQCHALHIDEGEYATKPHKTHTCQECGEHFQPALVPTVGVKFLPGCKSA